MNHDGLDLDAYLLRIGVAGPLRADRETLHRLIDQHVCAIPFENLDVLLGRPIRLDLPSIAQKIVENRRGGYCFEQNTLFAAVLRRLGFRLRVLGARVQSTTGAIYPRTHMVLDVEVEQDRYLVDVGFGGRGPTSALVMQAGVEQQGRLDTYRLIEREHEIELQAKVAGEFVPLYTMGLEDYLPIDCEMANYWTSTHPNSRFTRELIVARADDQGRWILHGDELTYRRASGELTHQLLSTNAERLQVLQQHFGISFPSGTDLLCLSRTH